MYVVISRRSSLCNYLWPRYSLRNRPKKAILICSKWGVEHSSCVLCEWFTRTNVNPVEKHMHLSFAAQAGICHIFRLSSGLSLSRKPEVIYCYICIHMQMTRCRGLSLLVLVKIWSGRTKHASIFGPPSPQTVLRKAHCQSFIIVKALVTASDTAREMCAEKT